MPYIITVIALIVVGVGFTFTQQRGDEIVIAPTNQTDTESVSIETPSTPQLGTPVAIESTTTKEKNEDKKSAPAEAVIEEAIKDPEILPEPAPLRNDYTYKDGTYNAQNTYRTPEGTYTMDISIRVIDDIVATTDITFDAKGAESGYTKRFLSNYKSLVAGEDLEKISLSRVGGSSLTTKAFNTALNAVRAQAAL